MGIPGGIRARLALGLLLVVGVASLGAYLMVVPSLEKRLVDAKLEQLERDAFKVTPLLADLVDSPQTRLDGGVDDIGLLYSTRVVVFDVFGPPLTLQPRSDSAGTGVGALAKDGVALRTARIGLGAADRVRRGGIEYAEAAVPLPGGQVLLFSSSLSDQLATVSVIERRLLYATLVALGIALGLGGVAAAVHARRIRRLDRAADRIAEGEFGEPIVDAARDELGDLARSFDRMRVQLGTLDDARKAFVANASHELRTPLFSLAGFLELLADEELDEVTRRGFLQTTREQVDRLTALATDLLDLSRLDAGRMRLAAEDVELGEVARAVAEELGPVAETSGHEVRVEAPHALAIGDEERVLQAVRALARNAIVHTPSGTRVALVTGVDGDRAYLDVTDDGPGIPADDRDRVFHRFYRGGDGRRASGSGLGLAIARELVERMQGTLTVESRPGATRFRVSLPRDGVHST